MQQYRKNLGKVSLTTEGAWDRNKFYEILSIVYEEHTQHGFISRKAVPVGVDINNKEYWMPFNVSGYADNNTIILNQKESETTIKSYTLEEAIKSIASVGRKPGTILGFYNENTDRLDIGGRWELWQYNGVDVADWENVNSWDSIYYNYNKFAGWYRSEESLKKYIPFPEIGCYAYIGSDLNEAVIYRCDRKYVWTNTTEHVWDYIKVLVGGNVTVGENGNWFNNGVDTNIPASIKGENGKTPIIRNNNNILEVSYDNVNWTKISDEMAAWFRINNNKLEMSRHEAGGWEVMSDYIAAWFRWQSQGGQQAFSTGKIQITRDGITWTDLSGEFANNLRISRYIGTSESLPTSGIAEGTIYAKGPYYEDGDTLHEYPAYRLWVYAWKGNTLAWVDNGQFTSIAAGIVQETGDGEEVVMSQKAVTEKLSELGSKVDNLETYPLTIEYFEGVINSDNGEVITNFYKGVHTSFIDIRNSRLKKISVSDGYNLKYHLFGNGFEYKNFPSSALKGYYKSINLQWIGGERYVVFVITKGDNEELTVDEAKENVTLEFFNFDEEPIYCQMHRSIDLSNGEDILSYESPNRAKCVECFNIGDLESVSITSEVFQLGFGFYDNNGEFIKGKSLYPIDNINITELVDNASKFRFIIMPKDDAQITPSIDFPNILFKRKPTTKAIGQLKKEVSSSEDLLKNVLQLYSDKIVPSTYERGYYSNYGTSAGKFVSDSNWRCFVVRGNLGGRTISLFVSSATVNGWGCNCFDDDGNVLGYNTKTEYEYVLSKGTTWISLNFKMDVFTDEQLANLVVFFDLESKKSQSVLYKNRYLAIGSSSTEKVVAMYGEKGSYANRIAERNTMTLTNLGKSGYSMAETSSSVYGNLCHKSETFTDVYDIHTIMLGANDIQLGVTFNGIEETALTDFYGAMKYYINNFLERCPSCRWGIIVPFAIPHDDFDKMRTACKEIARYYGVPCLDINEYGYSGIFANTSESKYTDVQMTKRQEQYQSTAQHLNDFGMERLSYVVEKWMETL